MKAILINKPGEITVTDMVVPEIKEGEALVKIRYCGICGADVASYIGNQPFTTYPRIPGHEFSAEIVEIAENETFWRKVLTRVFRICCGKPCRKTP